MITLEDVTFSYPNSSSSALKSVSLTIPEGAFVAVLGANGSGKSTLAKLLNAILTPSAGSVLIDGLNSLSKPDIFAIRSKVGVVFQNPDTQIICDTVEDEIAFGLENMGLDACEMHRRIDLSLQFTGLSSLKDTNPQRLSGGQKQMVCIASVLAMQPKYLVLDEATSMLDPNGRKMVLDFVEKLHNTLGLTVIMITHNIEECLHADKVVVLDKGQVSFEGSVKELFSENIKLDSLALPMVTQITERLIAKGINLPHGILTVDELCKAIKAVKAVKTWPNEGSHA